MMQFNARQYSSGAEIYEAARALRYLHAAPVRQALKPVELPAPPEPPARRVQRILPCWMSGNVRFDAHIHAWGAWKALYERNAIRYLRARSIELGFTYPDLVIDDRRQSHVIPRSVLIWELRTYFGKTWMEISRAFGDRDHSTIIHAFRRIERMKAEGKV